MKLYRRFCSAMLALCIIFSLSPAAYALGGDRFELLSLAVELPEADAVRVRLRADEACTLVAALYKDGALLVTGTVPVTGAGGEREVSVPLSGGGTGYDLAKAFLVDSKTWTPLCDSISLSPMQQRVAALGLPGSWQEELLRADAMGFPMEKLEQSTVSGMEMSLLLDHLVEYAAPDKLAEWRALLPDFAAYEEPLTRFDAMAGLFLAAQTIGGRWAEPVEKIGEIFNELDYLWGPGYFSPGLFIEENKPIYMSLVYVGEYQYLDIACFCYNFSRRSDVSGEYPFAYDAGNNSIHENDPPTYAEAVLAVIRLILSDDGAGDAQPVLPLTAEKDTQLKRDLQSAIDAILNTGSEIARSDTFVQGETYTGTAYYVSADGDDDNNGLSPNTPWRTLEKVCHEASGWEYPGILKKGDAVFFRRGDVFRFDKNDQERTLNIVTPGITFSAYGEGAKPIITGSSESGVGAEKWTLEFEDKTTGVKIWKYYHDLRDTASVVLNNGEAITRRVYEFWGKKGYESCECNTWWEDTIPEGGVELKGELLPLQVSMTEDLTIISRPCHNVVGDYVNDADTGPLYLRCDKGNPGELYSSIEFSELETMGLVWLKCADTVFDNISFRCNGNSFIKTAGGIGAEFWAEWAGFKNTVVQNCELAYCGGGVVAYWTMDNGESFIVPQGDTIYNVVNNTTIRGNYFHDLSASIGTFEADDGYPTLDGYYHVLDNVMVNTAGIRLDSTFEPLRHLTSVIVRGNQIWNTGRLDEGCFFYSEGSVFLTANHYDKFVIEGNVFYGTENGDESNGLLHMITPILPDTAMPVFANNTYVQHRGRYFMYFVQDRPGWTIDDPDLMYMVRRYLRDTTSEFYVMD